LCSANPMCPYLLERSLSSVRTAGPAICWVSIKQLGSPEPRRFEQCIRSGAGIPPEKRGARSGGLLDVALGPGRRRAGGCCVAERAAVGPIRADGPPGPRTSGVQARARPGGRPGDHGVHGRAPTFRVPDQGGNGARPPTCRQSQTFYQGYGSSLPTSLTYMQWTLRPEVNSPWRPDAVISYDRGWNWVRPGLGRATAGRVRCPQGTEVTDARSSSLPPDTDRDRGSLPISSAAAGCPLIVLGARGRLPSSRWLRARSFHDSGGPDRPGEPEGDTLGTFRTDRASSRARCP
jgi:hypothetical protein